MFDVDIEDNNEDPNEENKGETSKSSKEDLIMEISPNNIEQVKEACIKYNYPLIEEYDFRRDRTSPDLKIDLKSTT